MMIIIIGIYVLTLTILFTAVVKANAGVKELYDFRTKGVPEHKRNATLYMVVMPVVNILMIFYLFNIILKIKIWK